MPGIAQICKLALVLGSVVVEAAPKFNNARPRMIEIRAPKPLAQEPASASATTSASAAATTAAAAPAAAAPAGNLTDTDILQLYVLLA
jgi:predicted lipid-binding transport protein (Tim44 family)